MRYEQNCKGRKRRSGKYRSDNVWKAVITENSKILGMFARTERSQMVLNDNHEQLSGSLQVITSRHNNILQKLELELEYKLFIAA